MRGQAWYVLGTLILILRHAVRLRTVGLRGYQGDDYLSIVVCHFAAPREKFQYPTVLTFSPTNA